MKELVIYGSESLGRMACQIMEDINEDANEWHLHGFIEDAGELFGKNTHGYGSKVDCQVRADGVVNLANSSIISMT